jgi:glycine/D-amino acid oxidase-like deaminating enzyme
MREAATRSMTVLGAGIVGVCCALSLQRDGFSVCLIDRGEPGAGCSSGNAAMIQTGSILPLAVPGILKRAPRMLLDPEGPLVVPWQQVPRLIPWLRAFIRNAKPEKVAATTRALAALLAQAKDAYRVLAAGTPASGLFRSRGELYVFRNAAAQAMLAGKFATLRAHGIAYVDIPGGDLKTWEPALADGYAYGYYLPDSEYVVDPLGLTRGLFDAFVDAGGRFLRTEIEHIQRAQDGRLALHARGDAVHIANELVVASGAASGRMARMLGAAMPIEPLRGYHVQVPADGITLAGPVIEGDMNIAATPMRNGIRIAGTLEFAGFESPPRWRRADMLLPIARRMLPGLREEANVRWFGDRPGTPDSLPVLGAAPGHSNVWYAFGHGQLGLTLAAITGRLLADLMTGRQPSVDLTPFRPDRFVAVR